MSIGSQTTNLGLTVVDGPSGSLVLFLDWRLTINGLSSNMTIIDDWAGVTNACLISLSGQRGAIYTYASYVSGTLYAATVSSITSLSAGTIIDLSLNKTSVAGAQLDINGYGTKNLYKVNSVGSNVAIAANDLVINRHYLFYYDGSQWIWINATSGDQINIPSSSVSQILMVSSGSGITPSGVSASSISVCNLRQGGDSTNWDTYGNTSYLASSRIVVGRYINSVAFEDLISGEVTVTLPYTFTYHPLIIIGDLLGDDDAGNYPFIIGIIKTINNNSFILQWKSVYSETIKYLSISWMAIGPR